MRPQAWDGWGWHGGGLTLTLTLILTLTLTLTLLQLRGGEAAEGGGEVDEGDARAERRGQRARIPVSGSGRRSSVCHGL